MPGEVFIQIGLLTGYFDGRVANIVFEARDISNHLCFQMFDQIS